MAQLLWLWVVCYDCKITDNYDMAAIMAMLYICKDECVYNHRPCAGIQFAMGKWNSGDDWSPSGWFTECQGRYQWLGTITK